jgi:dinuclear metal center YbgI/SA1388 family protein
MKVKDIVKVVEQLAPPSLTAAWDNPGLLVGDAEAECSKIMVALDLSKNVLEQAEQQGCQLILTHHPFIFQAQKKVLAHSYEGDLILRLAQHNIAALAAHTNWDNAEGGINWTLAEALQLTNIRAIAEPPQEILLLAGDLPRDLSAGELTEHVRKALGLPVLRAAGLRADKSYRRVAVCGGAAMEYWTMAAAAGCDALVSADPKHHEGLQAEHCGFAVLDGTHYATEIIGIHRLGELVREKLPDLTVCFAETEDSWAYYGAAGQKL